METSTLQGWDNNKRPVARGYPPEVVQRYCVQDKNWQQIRLSMKGKPTHKKLEILEAYWDRNYTRVRRDAGLIVEVQVGNYLGALRRGGQLDANNQIKRYI
jgi:hypothetical protein